MVATCGAFVAAESYTFNICNSDSDDDSMSGGSDIDSDSDEEEELKQDLTHIKLKGQKGYMAQRLTNRDPELFLKKDRKFIRKRLYKGNVMVKCSFQRIEYYP